VNVIRSIPDLVYATILVAMAGVGVLPGLITLFLFDIGIIVKLVSEAIDSADHAYMEGGRAAGGTQAQINRSTALPQSWPLFANQWLYTLELNVRISAILGIVGAGGIGRLIDERRAFYAYDDVSLIVLEILVVVVLIEVASNLLRKRLV
jgi:phosphonate transport system permease protein